MNNKNKLDYFAGVFVGKVVLDSTVAKSQTVPIKTTAPPVVPRMLLWHLMKNPPSARSPPSIPAPLPLCPHQPTQ